MNKKNKILFIFLITSSIFFTACQKDLNTFVPDPGQPNAPDTTWYNTIAASQPVITLQKNLQLNTIKDSFEITNSTTATVTLNAGGLQCTFSPMCCVNGNGQIVTGKIYADIVVIKKKGDMVLMNKPTMSDGKMLITGGELFISLKKDGQELNIAPGASVQIRYPALQTNTAMQLFFGDETNPERFNWIPNQDSLNNRLNIGQQVYEIITNRLRWINLDYFYNSAGMSLSTITTKMPQNYTNANTTVFLVFSDLQSVLRLNANVAQKHFVIEKIPNGKVVTMVAISKQGNDYFLGKEIITTGLNTISGIQQVQITPVKSSLSAIKDFVATL